MGESRRIRLAVLISGTGTNLQSLIDKSRSGVLKAEIVTVLSDRYGAYGLVRAEQAGIPWHVVDYRNYLRMDDPFRNLPISKGDLLRLSHRQRIFSGDRGSEDNLKHLAALVCAEDEITRVLSSYQPDYICFAGFMRLVTPYFLDQFNRGTDYRVINIHPALLPAFPGRYGYEDTYSYGCRWGGVTVHFVDEGEDSGPIIAQGVYPIWPEDNLGTIRRKGLFLEHLVYAQCVNWLAEGHVKVIKESGSRVKVHITDPGYHQTVRQWTEYLLATFKDESMSFDRE